MVWLYVYGRFPSGGISHINGKLSANFLSNLVEAEEAKDVHPKRQRKGDDRISGVKGVVWCARDGVWIVNRFIGGKRVYLGSHKYLEEAIIISKKKI